MKLYLKCNPMMLACWVWEIIKSVSKHFKLTGLPDPCYRVARIAVYAKTVNLRIYLKKKIQTYEAAFDFGSRNSSSPFPNLIAQQGCHILAI